MNNAIQLKAADAFASAHGYSASVVRLRNTSDVSIDYSVSGGDAVELAAGASAVVDVAALTSEISVRRTDLSTTPVNVMLEFGLDPDEAYVFAVENATGSITSVASSDITDAGTAGKAVLTAETQAQGRTALGLGETIISNIDEDYVTPELTQNTKLYFSPSEDRACDITAGAEQVGTKLFLYHSGSGDFKETVTYATGKTFVMTQKMFYELEKVPGGWLITDSNSKDFIDWDECPYSMARTAEIDATNHIYELTVTGDKTAYFKAGQKIKFTQDASTKYAIITYVETSDGNTILTVYGGTDYTISANSITSARLAKVNRPYDFNCNEEKWTISIDFAIYTRSSPVENTLYYTGNSFNGEKGSWKYKGRIGGACSHSAGSGYMKILASESSSSDVNSILRFTNKGYAAWANVSDYFDNKTLSVRTPLYFLISYSADGANSINFLGTSSYSTGLKITPCGI